MPYAERAYFDNDHCQHCADREEAQRRARLRKQALDALNRRR